MHLLDSETRAVVQGITGRVGRAQTRWMLAAGTRLVAGVTPGRSGQMIESLPVYNTVAEAVALQAANASVIFVPAAAAYDAAIEALEAGVHLIVIVTEHIPVRDSMDIKRRAALARATVIGPNCPGICVPGSGKLGIMPFNLFMPGCVGVVGRSATLSYEVIAHLTQAGLGQTAAVGIGGDPVVCTEFTDVLDWFEADASTEAVVLVGEIGGAAEERAARRIARMTKPVVALIAGRHAPAGKRFGHAGAIVHRGDGAAADKVRALTAAGAAIADTPTAVPVLVADKLGRG
jgi:succinyl-CoA synthetase alpha subunit